MPDGMPPIDIVPNLTDDQREQLKKAELKNTEAMTPLHNQLREKMARMNTILSTSPLNQKEADQLAEEIGRINASMIKQLIRHDQEIRALLTPGQQIIFDSRPKPFLMSEKMGMKARHER